MGGAAVELLLQFAAAAARLRPARRGRSAAARRPARSSALCPARLPAVRSIFCARSSFSSGLTEESRMTAVPASIASSRCSSMSAVKIGVSTSRPITTPAWRAEIVQPPWIACGARPPSAVSVSAESTSESPIPIRICGGRVSATSAFGRKARPASPPETRIAPAAARARALGDRGRRAGCRGSPPAASP